MAQSSVVGARWAAKAFCPDPPVWDKLFRVEGCEHRLGVGWQVRSSGYLTVLPGPQTKLLHLPPDIVHSSPASVLYPEVDF